MRIKVVAHLFDVRMIDNLNSAFLQLACIRRDVCQIIRNESDPMTELAKSLEDLEHPQRSGIPVGTWKMMIDHQNILAARGSLPQKCQITVCRLFHQLNRPCFRECGAVDILVFFCAGGEVRSASGPFVVNNLTKWLV